MAKIKISADTVLTILKGIMDDSDINYTVTDKSAPRDWRGKTVQEILNVEYYTFKHRPVDTEIIVEELINQGKDFSETEALNRAFCILSLGSTERAFSRLNDIATVSVNLEYWIQTDKVKLLEDMVEDIVVESTGIRIPVKIGSEERQVLLAVGNLQVSELEENTEFGEMAVCDLTIDMVFYPKVVSMSDYTVEFFVIADEGKYSWVTVPCSSLSFSHTMTQKAVPMANKVRSVGSINLSRVKTITLAFDGYVNAFIDKITSETLLGDFFIDKSAFESTENVKNATIEKTEDIDNNESLILRLTRGEEYFYYCCIVKEHTVIVQEDTGNETHSLTLTTSGVEDIDKSLFDDDNEKEEEEEV